MGRQAAERVGRWASEQTGPAAGRGSRQVGGLAGSHLRFQLELHRRLQPPQQRKARHAPAEDLGRELNCDVVREGRRMMLCVCVWGWGGVRWSGALQTGKHALAGPRGRQHGKTAWALQHRYPSPLPPTQTQPSKAP